MTIHYHPFDKHAPRNAMNEANTLADVIGHDPEGAPVFPRDPACPAPPAIDEALVYGFCGYLTADIPELHGIHPQKLADSWARFKACVADGFHGVFFDPNGEG
jgi:hypothetical protein